MATGCGTNEGVAIQINGDIVGRNTDSIVGVGMFNRSGKFDGAGPFKMFRNLAE